MKRVLDKGRTEELWRDRDILITYLKMKTNQEDWHAVSDAAIDIRELEARIKGLE